MEVDAAGNLYVANSCDRIEKVAPGGSIATIAGTYEWGFRGDGVSATSATLFSPSGLALAADGSLYIADFSNERIRRIAPNQIISTIAGSGYSGDSGQALGAGLAHPMGTAYDAAGNLYIAESAHNRVRKVTPAGVITTVAGTGLAGFSGDGGFAVEAQLFNPVDVAVDAVGNLYIADRYNYRIRVVYPNGVIWTIAGNGDTGTLADYAPPLEALIDPVSLAVKSNGDLR